MQLKKTIKQTMTSQQIKGLRNVVVHSRVLQANGFYEVEYTQYSMMPYEVIVNRLVKEKYSDSSEFAILRKVINNPNNEEFISYNNYVENCKLQAKAFIAERDKALALNK